MTSNATISILDYDGENTRTTVTIDAITAGNLTTQLGLVSDLQSAIGGIILGNIATRQVVAEVVFVSRTPATDTGAQREQKWLVRSEDTVTHELLTNQIGTADDSLLSGHNEKITVFPVGVLGSFKDAWEAVVLSPRLNPVTLISLELVGRRL